jgi:hypothetical protein
MIVNQYPLHFEIGLFTRLLVLELNKCVLQAVARSFVANDLTREDITKAAKD